MMGKTDLVSGLRDRSEYHAADEIEELREKNERLVAALTAAEEALFWYKGLAFEFNGETVGQQIINVLGPTDNRT